MKRLYALFTGAAILYLFSAPTHYDAKIHASVSSADLTREWMNVPTLPTKTESSNQLSAVESQITPERDPDCTESQIKDESPEAVVKSIRQSVRSSETAATVPAEVTVKETMISATLKRTSIIEKQESEIEPGNTLVKIDVPSVEKTQTEIILPESVTPVAEETPAVPLSVELPVETSIASELTATHVSNVTEVSNKFSNPSNIKAETGSEGSSYFSIYERAEQLKAYAVKNGYNTRYALLVDMGIKSSRKRFFIVDLSSYEIVNRGLVTHGKGSENFATDKKYSNEPGSKCTSLGVYKVGKAFDGEFGQAYKLHGLSNTNSNAFQRFIVLHTMNGVPDMETTTPIVQTEGCPSISPKFMQEVKPLIEKSAKPVLLWIFDSGADGAVANK